LSLSDGGEAERHRDKNRDKRVQLYGTVREVSEAFYDDIHGESNTPWRKAISASCLQVIRGNNKINTKKRWNLQNR
jgi:hypothetical protein